MAELVLQPARTDEELRQWLAIRNDVLSWWPLGIDTALHAGRRGVPRVALNALHGGEILGGAVVVLPPMAHEAATHAFGNIWVRPAHRKLGIGSALYRAISGQAGEWERSGLEGAVYEHEKDGLAFAVRRGFREVARSFKLQLDLAASEPDEAVSPPGVEIATLAQRPDLTQALYRAEVESIPDVPAPEPYRAGSFEEWQARELEAPDFGPDRCFLALVGGEVVGYAILLVRPERPDVGEHEMTGVRRAWRGRGIAGALKRAQIAWAKQAGLRTLETENHEDNAPIRSLNERLGYRPASATLTMRGPLASGQPDRGALREPRRPRGV